jgi:hypothetical protein
MSFSDFESILELQGWAKIILLFLILSNFIIILGLKFQINIITKIKSMFDIKDIKKDVSSTKTVLLIITHPEDTISYWSPTIKTLTNYNIKLKILCILSPNNSCDQIFTDNDNEKNFENLSKILKLEDNKIVKLSSFEPENISKEIKKFLDDNNDIGTILSFDENGAGNAEHANCYEGLELFLKNNREEIKRKEIKIFLLDSFNDILKYSLLIPMIFFYFKEFGFNIISWFQFNKWIKIHKNLEIGFLKKIKLFFNCYSYFNSFTKVELK